MSLILGIESSCDETAAALVAVRPAHPRPPPRRPGGGAPALWRRRPRDRRPRPCRDPAAPDRGGAGRGAGRARRGRRHRRDRRPRPDRRGDGRPGHRQGAGAGRRQAADRGQPSRRPCAVADADRSGPCLSLSAAARLGRPLPIAARRGRRPLPPPRHHHRRRRRRGVRQEREAARPRLSRRAGGRARGGARAIPRRCRCRGRWSARTSRISPSPASRARCCARRRAGAMPTPTSPPRSSRRWSIASSTAPRRALAAADGATALVVAGGVAANRAIRGALAELAAAHGLPFVAPPLWLCTDNAAMIAWAGRAALRSRAHRRPRRAGPRPLAARSGRREGARRGGEGVKLGRDRRRRLGDGAGPGRGGRGRARCCSGRASPRWSRRSTPP